MSEFMTDDDIMNMMAEESERQAEKDARNNGSGRGTPNGVEAASPAAAAQPPKAGQHVDVAALLGGRPQPQQAGTPESPVGVVGSPASAAASERAAAAERENTRSRFASFFKLEDAPAGGVAGASRPCLP